MTVHVEFANTKIENLDGHKSIIEAELDRHGFTGKWTVSPGKRLKRFIASGNFDVTRIESMGGMQGLRMFTMPNGRESTWNSLLVPPNKYVLEDVLATLRGFQAPEESENEEQPVVTPANHHGKGLNWSPGTLEFKLRPGTVYWADVRKVETDYVEVALTKDLFGIVPKNAWNSGGTFDKKVGFQTCSGERIKVLLVKIADSALEFDRGSVVDYPDDAVVNAASALLSFSPEIKNDTISLRGFLDDHDNAIWLLEALALEYSTICEDLPFPPTNSITKLWSNMVFTRYKCSKIASPLSPIFRAFVSRGWLEPVYSETFTKLHKDRPYGYALTELGWSEANASDFGAVWLRKTEEHKRTMARHMPVQEPETVIELPPMSEEQVYKAIGEQVTIEVIQPSDTPDDEDWDADQRVVDIDLIDPIPLQVPLYDHATELLEFREKWVRLADVDQRMAEITREYDALEIERQTINAWIEQHPEILKKVQSLKGRKEELQRQRQELDSAIQFMDQLFG